MVDECGYKRNFVGVCYAHFGDFSCTHLRFVLSVNYSLTTFSDISYLGDAMYRASLNQSWPTTFVWRCYFGTPAVSKSQLSARMAATGSVYVL